MKIAVLGAGLMGRVLSMRLYQEGYTDLTLIDRDAIGDTTSPAYIAAGMLAPFCESIMGGILIYKLGKDSNTLWQNYLSGLNSLDLYNDNGTLLISLPGFNEEVKHYLNKISFNTGIDNFYTKLDKVKVVATEPELNFNDAYLLFEEGNLNAREVFKHLEFYLLPRVNWISETVIDYTTPNRELVIHGVKHQFDLVIDCRGLGSNELQKDLRGVRGEIIRVHAPDVNISHPVRLFHPRHVTYVVPYGNQRYIIGATEIEAEDFSHVSVRSILDLLNCTYSLHSGFAEARILEMSANCRPTLPDNLPRIVLKGQCIGINGLYRHGYLLAPILAETVITYLKHGVKNYPEIWS